MQNSHPSSPTHASEQSPLRFFEDSADTLFPATPDDILRLFTVPSNDIEPFVLPRSKGDPREDPIPSHTMKRELLCTPAPAPNPYIPTELPLQPPPAPAPAPAPAPLPYQIPKSQGFPFFSNQSSSPQTPRPSPLSIGTPCPTPGGPSSCCATPMLPTSHLTPVTPVAPPPTDELIEYCTRLVGPVLCKDVEAKFHQLQCTARAKADSKKIMLRNRLKLNKGQRGSQAEIASRREAKVSRAFREEYNRAMESGAERVIEENCLLRAAVLRLSAAETGEGRKRQRFV